MHFCGVRPWTIKLLADFSVLLQTIYATWKDYTAESGKNPMSLKGKCSPSARFPPGNPLRMTSQTFSQTYGSPELVYGINIFSPYAKSSQHKGCTEFAQFQQEKSECNV